MIAGQLIVAGLLTGSVYALIAVGLVVVYKSSNVLNFAHGYVAALGAFLSFTIVQEYHLGWPLGIGTALAATTGSALLIEFIVIRRLPGARPLTLLAATLGIALIYNGILNLAYGPSPKGYPNILPGRAFTAFGLTILGQDVLVFFATLVIIGGLALFFARSRLGISMRAASEDARVASLLGIDFRTVSMVSWGLSGLLGGLAAILVAPRLPLTPDALTTLMIQGFAAVVIAGFTSIWGAVVGGYITGVALNLISGYVVSDMPSTVLLILLLVLLLVRPQGIFGRHEEVRL